MTTPRKTLRERLDEPWLADVDWTAEERKSPWPLANVLREGPKRSASQKLATLTTRSRRSRRMRYWLLAVLIPLLIATMAAAIAQAAVTPSPKTHEPALVCQVLDGTRHADEWLTREDAQQRVDVIKIMLGVDVQMRCKPSSFADHILWTLFAADASARALDAYSTQRALQCSCNREVVLPDSISHNAGALWAYNETVPLFNLALSRLLNHYGHKRLARLPFVIDVGLEVPAAVKNLNLHASQPSGWHRAK